MCRRRFPFRLALAALSSALGLSIAGSAAAQTPSQISVTGNLSGLSTSTSDILQARLTLVNCGAANPVIPNVTTLVMKTLMLTANPSTGAISGSVWGNDAVTCNGIQPTLYQVQYLRNSIPTGVAQTYRITSLNSTPSFNLTTATPATVLPPTANLESGFECAGGTSVIGVLADLTPVCSPANPTSTPLNDASLNTYTSALLGNPTQPQTVTPAQGTSFAVNGPLTSTNLESNGQSACLGNGSGCQSAASAAIVGVSVDGSTMAENSFTDRFFADLHQSGTNPDNSMLLPGWDLEVNTYAQQGHWNCKTCTTTATPPAAVPAYMVRGLYFTGDTSFALQGTLYYSAGLNNNNCIELTNATLGTYTTNLSQIIGTCFTSGGWTMVNQGVTTSLSTLPFSPANYDVSMWAWNGQVYLSAIQQGTNNAVTATFPSGQTIPPNLNNLQVTSSAVSDQQANIRYSVGGPALNFVNMPYDGNRYGLSGELTSATAGTTWVMLPHGYRPGVPNRWVLYIHGLNELGWSISGAGTYGVSGGNAGIQSVANTLLNDGYIVIGFTQTNPACYGNQQCMTDLANIITEWKAKLSLAPQPYLMADSMGGFTMLNAIANGIVNPRAVVGMCINTNLSWDFGAGGANSLITSAYAISPTNSYAAATGPQAGYAAGFDPLLASAFSSGLLNFTRIPMALWSSYGDTVALRALNTDLFASMVNGAGGNVTVITSSGNHEDPSNFNPSYVANFFNSH